MRRLVLGSVMVFATACLQAVEAQDAGSGIPADAGSSVIVDAGAPDAGPTCAPASERSEWKLKFVFVVEQSGAMCLVDPPGSQESTGLCEQTAPLANVTGATMPARVRELMAFSRAVANRPDVTMALIPFETNLKGFFPITGFSRGSDFGLLNRISGLQAELGSRANLQTALESARTRIEFDLLQRPDAERTHTHYVVVVLSTGVPSPRCSRNDLLMPFGSAARPELVWADTDTRYCNDVTSDIPPSESISTFVPGTSINQNAQLFDLADAFRAMEGWYGVKVSVHTRQLVSDRNLAACGALCDHQLTNGLNVQDTRTVGRYVLSELARRGGGTFVDPGEPSNLSLMDLASLEPTTFCAE